MSIDTERRDLSILRQCELLGLARSTFYYKPRGASAYNLELMRLLDEQYTRTPFYGIRRMTVFLNKQGHGVNHKRVRRLMRLMGLETIYPKRRRLSVQDGSHTVYPYLLNGLAITRPNQVWASDITYIRMKKGFLYLVAVMDWYSRYVLSWALSNSLDVAFCIEALEDALRMSAPQIFNSDQGTQFTSEAFTSILRANGVKISMDGRGRVFDNIFIERLWRTLKYEEVYIKEYRTVQEATENIARYFHFYNWERFHESFDYRTPHQVYYETSKIEEKGGYTYANYTP